ncbi:MAG: hypothetical protein PHF18_17270 [Methanosarcina sp.]|nr:hypothetical protein [Methanosarcina sp.]MDD4249911.1 hypothetical protein [Methanosarcina sp.]
MEREIHSGLRGSKGESNNQDRFEMVKRDDKLNPIERAVLKLGEPENQGRLLQIAWLISLLMMVFGLIIILRTIFPNFTVT